MTTDQQTRPSFDDVLNSGSDDFSMTAIREDDTGYTAFIRTKRGTYLLGTFSTEQQARQALQDAEDARMTG